MQTELEALVTKEFDGVVFPVFENLVRTYQECGQEYRRIVEINHSVDQETGGWSPYKKHTKRAADELESKIREKIQLPPNYELHVDLATYSWWTNSVSIEIPSENRTYWLYFDKPTDIKVNYRVPLPSDSKWRLIGRKTRGQSRNFQVPFS